MAEGLPLRFHGGTLNPYGAPQEGGADGLDQGGYAVTASNTLKYREEWLMESVKLFRPWFLERKVEIPQRVMISCGFPKGARGGHAIGQCWGANLTPDGTSHMFVCPTLIDPIEVLATTLHECTHAACGLECGHKGEFKRMAVSLGLQGKMTATYCAPNTPLHDALSQVAEVLGPYPHSKLTPIKKPKKESNWVRLMSPDNEEYTLVISQISIDEMGMPQDPWGNEMIPKGKKSRKK